MTDDDVMVLLNRLSSYVSEMNYATAMLDKKKFMEANVLFSDLLGRIMARMMAYEKALIEIAEIEGSPELIENVKQATAPIESNEVSDFVKLVRGE